MVFKKIFVLLFLISIIGTTYALTTIDELFTTPENAIEKYNNKLQDMPGALRNFVGSEKIQLNVNYETETKTITLVMKNAHIESYSFDNSIKPTLIIQADKEKMDNIINSNNQVKAFKQAIREKRLIYDAKGLFKKIKFSFARFILIFIK